MKYIPSKSLNWITLIVIVTFYACGQSDNQNKVTEEKSKPTEEVKQESENQSNGEEIYKKTCIACHQADGNGIANTFPPLAKSDFLNNSEAVIEQVIKGKSGELVVNGTTYNNTMPPQDLNDAEIAKVLTYVYENWGNNGTKFDENQVKAVRDKIKNN